VGFAILINVLSPLPEPRPLGDKTMRSAFRGFSVLAVLMAAAGCSTSVGPSRHAIEKAPVEAPLHGIQVVEIRDGVGALGSADGLRGDFAASPGDATPIGTTVGVGDSLSVTIWEAAPAALFGTTIVGTDIGSTIQTSQPNSLPEILVGPSGTITVPFAGEIPAAGRTLRQIERDIVARLQGRAHLPQAMVRIARNATANVTVLGDVKAPQRIPLTPRGERLLEAIALAGGTNEALDRMTIQISRGGVVQRMPAADIIRDPRQNIILQSDDVISVSYQPYSFTVLGATGRNEEIRFEGVGLTLSQALGRIGGLQGDRADPRGVFLFRWELPQVLGEAPAGVQPNAEGKIPVIYRADLKEPATFFAAQNFQMRDGDIIYVSNSKLSDLQRFVSVVASSILPVSTVRNIAR
jgi:polysaccharide export outer membrane protein